MSSIRKPLMASDSNALTVQLGDICSSTQHRTYIRLSPPTIAMDELFDICASTCGHP
eukprot:CAMPEP_0201933182 /NCGR_PEP_ID=MMETSP0903-20130614/30996_1 /ASSEMBLY_ACC=CAM_ASM_000552 /TAXON_ID=420261 /ORGANISM="Thalassiosira antarctica, Strain CCMP982" /LENGTH=56 /DNA_ID=CAMNT_0048473031 /DNA_START=5 /DNA_END=175 /DNA_ORIENTATION=+